MSILAIVSKSEFEKAVTSPIVGALWPVSTYFSGNPGLEPLRGGGDLYLVTARPGDKLWLAAVLRSPKKDSKGWTAKANTTPIHDATSLIKKLRFSTGKGLAFGAGKLGMSLQAPRQLTADDVALFEALIAPGRAAATAPAPPPTTKPPTKPPTKATRPPAPAKTPSRTPAKPKPGQTGASQDGAGRWSSAGAFGSFELVASDLGAELPAFAAAVIGRPRAELERLVLAEADFDPSSEAPSEPILPADTAARMFAALPGLRSLELRGHGLVGKLVHPNLAELRMVGLAAPDAFLDPDALPMLERFAWVLPSDEHGVALDSAGLAGLLSGRATPRLVDLDLSELEVDGDMFALEALRRGSLPTTLRVLRLREADGKVLHKVLPALERVDAGKVSNAAVLTSSGTVVTKLGPTKPAKRPLVVRGSELLDPARYSVVHTIGEKLGDKDVIAIATALEDGPERLVVRTVQLDLKEAGDSSGLTPKGVTQLIPTVARLPRLEALIVDNEHSNLRPGTPVVEAVARHIRRPLRLLALRGLTGGDATFEQLAVIVDNALTRDLDISGAQTPARAFASFAKRVANSELNGLTLSGLEVKNEWPALVAALDTLLSGGLAELHLGGFQIGDEGARSASKALARSRLKRLTLSGNKTTGEGLASLFEGVARAKVERLTVGSYSGLRNKAGQAGLAAMLRDGALQDLTLGDEHDDPDHVAALAKAVKGSRTLKALSVAALRPGHAHVLRLVDALGKLPAFRALHATGWTLLDAQVDAVVKALGAKLEIASHLPLNLVARLLEVGRVREIRYTNGFSLGEARDVKRFYGAAKGSKTLERLFVGGTEHELGMVKELIGFVGKTASLRELEVCWCGLRPADYAPLARAILDNPHRTLTHLRVLTPTMPPAARATMQELAAARGIDVS